MLLTLTVTLLSAKEARIQTKPIFSCLDQRELPITTLQVCNVGLKKNKKKHTHSDLLCTRQMAVAAMRPVVSLIAWCCTTANVCATVQAATCQSSQNSGINIHCNNGKQTTWSTSCTTCNEIFQPLRFAWVFLAFHFRRNNLIKSPCRPSALMAQRG